MYTFELKLIDMRNGNKITRTIQIDSTPVELSEREVFCLAMEKAYNISAEHDYFMFDSLEFISC